MIGTRIHTISEKKMIFWCWRDNRGVNISFNWFNDPALKWLIAIGKFNAWQYRSQSEMTPEQKVLNDIQFKQAHEVARLYMELES